MINKQKKKHVNQYGLYIGGWFTPPNDQRGSVNPLESSKKAPTPRHNFPLNPQPHFNPPPPEKIV